MEHAVATYGPLALALAGLGSGIGIGLIGYAWLTGIARNPEAGGKMFVPAIMALAFAEAVAIYGLVIAFMK